MKTKHLFFGIILSLFVFTGVQAQYKVGDVAGDFSLKNVNDKMVSLDQFSSAKGFIVVFTCNTCPVAKKYQSRIEALDKKFKSKDYPVIAINSNDGVANPGDSFAAMQKRAKAESYTFPYLLDESQAVAKRFGATNTPHVFVLEKEGTKLVVKYVGAIDNNVDDASMATKKYVEEAVNSLLEGKSPEVAATKAIGCGIKWKKA